MNKTFFPAKNYNTLSKRKWYVFDCKKETCTVGRLASLIVPILIGKLKPYYHPSVDVGDYVIVINSEYLKFNRDVERFHVYQPGRPGTSLKRLVNVVPKQIIENCVFNMLPNGFPKKHLVKRLKVYQGNQHPHEAQKPDELVYNENGLLAGNMRKTLTL
jgi:large subunit ribosomal protein L13